MKLRRFEFGIATSDGSRVEVYALRGDGARYTKNFPPSENLLEEAELDFKTAPLTWQRTAEPTRSNGLTQVWQGRGSLYISGEAAITRLALEEANIDTIVSMSKLQPQTRVEVEEYLAAHPRTQHVETPILDVLARHQDVASTLNAARALRRAEEGIQNGENVLVHCLMGIHRSVAISVVALAHAKHFPTTREAFLHIQSKRSLAGWNPESVAWLERIANAAEVPP